MPLDLKKEIKLSDLVPKRTPKAPRQASRPANADRRKSKKADLVGLKIGASQLAAAHVVNNGNARLVQVAREPLDPGIVIAGEVRDIAALGRALDEFFTRTKLPRKNVRLGVGTNRVGVRALDVSGIEDERQLDNAVRFRAHEALSIPMDQAVLDYHLVSTDASSGGTTHHVVVAAAYREPIDHLVAACDAAKLNLSGIDVEAFALLRAVASGSQEVDGEPTAVVALSLGHDRSTLAISDGTICDFTRVLDWGGAKLDTAIGRELGLSANEIEPVKLSLALDDETADGNENVRAAVRRELTVLAREIIASLQFYQSQPGSLAISELLITGGTTRMPGLVPELERLTRVRISVADPLAAVEPAPGISDRDDLASLAIAIGLGVDR